MLLLARPVVFWARHGTALTAGDVAKEAMPSVMSGAVAGLVSFIAARYTYVLQPAILRLTVDSTILFVVFGVMMLVTLKDKSVYWKMLTDAGLVPAGTKPPA